MISMADRSLISRNQCISHTSHTVYLSNLRRMRIQVNSLDR
jgi:hypothetical protein